MYDMKPDCSEDSGMEHNPAFGDIFDKMEKLPTLPGVAVQILQAVQKEDPDLEEIGNILAHDPPLSAEVLKIINSVLYSLPTQITSVHHAVKMLGISTVKNLALSFSLIKNNRAEEGGDFNYTNFWKDSLIGAISAKLLAVNVQPDISEDAFFIGLLQNIGILTLIRCMPKPYDLVLKEMQTAGCSYHEAEDQILGFNHMAVGEYLVKSWGLPEIFYTPMGHHHNPDNLNTDHPYIETLTKILHLSSLYIDLFNLPDMSMNLYRIEEQTKAYGYEEKINIDEIGLKINEQTQHIFPLFEIDLKEEKDYTQLLDAARKELIKLSSDFMNQLVDQKKEIETLRKQSTCDGMTQLNNHQRFHELLHQEVYRSNRYKVPLSLILGDIDHFKSVNDTHGHPAGDHAIKMVADCLKNALRESDHLARYGGEEFAVTLPETPMAEALKVAERLRKAIQSLNIEYEEKPISLTMSFGVAALPSAFNISGEELVKRADSVLYRSKARGRNQVCGFNGDNVRH
jgi:diguanylate cyclase (GGDEF)-like protein